MLKPDHGASRFGGEADLTREAEIGHTHTSADM